MTDYVLNETFVNTVLDGNVDERMLVAELRKQRSQRTIRLTPGLKIKFSQGEIVRLISKLDNVLIATTIEPTTALTLGISCRADQLAGVSFQGGDLHVWGDTWSVVE